MYTAVINIKTEEETKKKAQAVAQEIGVSLSALINTYLKHLIITKRVELSVDEEEPSDYLIRLIRQADKALKTGKASPRFDNAKDAIAYLEKQGI